MDCPKCLGKLQRENIACKNISEVKKPQGGGLPFELEADKCLICGGVWLDKGELDKYLSGEIESVDSPSLGNEMDKRIDAKHGNCPRCGVKMAKAASFKNTGVTADACDQCQGVWLDYAEINILQKAANPKQGFWDLLSKGFKKG